ncbi:mas-related G-protein coupled receptor member H-like [Indicator indicator]|uniref:mas-related G-protein coupled receptor member H-like n=1 Tax=Indicator indicator TaxID=1002788 RepID=UPI0023DF404B|nr:mas-related G-protein coupled receptor member H-like [Indicator indicator]
MEKTITTVLSPRYMTTTYPEPEEYNYNWCETQSYAIWIISCVCICISLCGLVGNVVVVWFLGFCMKLNPFTVYVLNLAMANFCLLLVLLAKFTLHLTPSVFCIDDADFHFADLILSFLFLFCYLAGMYLLTAMSVERCLAALFPVWYRCHRSKHCSAVMSGVLWALAVLFLLFMPHPIVFMHCEFCLFSFFPLLSNLALFIKLRCGSQRRHPGKIYVAVLLSVIFLVVLGFPFSLEIVLFFNYRHVFYISFLLASLNSSINPIIYFLVGSCRQHRFQCSLKVAFRRLFEEGATSEERSQVPGDAVMETSVRDSAVWRVSRSSIRHTHTKESLTWSGETGERQEETKMVM